LVLSGVSSFTGGTVVSAGTLQLAPGGQLANAGNLTINGCTFDLNGQSQTIGALSGSGGTIALGSGNLTANGTVDTVLATTIVGTGNLTKGGTGTLTLTAANTYAGHTTVSGGTLRLNSGNDRLPVDTDLSLSNAGILALNGQNQTIASLSGASVSASIALGTGTLTVNQATATTFAGSINGTGGLTKLGPER
jgi:fibronectin-binding autotransporter adhesin